MVDTSLGNLGSITNTTGQRLLSPGLSVCSLKQKAVAWSFFGVRKSSDYAQDVAKINPVHVIVAGVLAAVLFVVGLVLLVRWIVTSGVAQ